MVPDDPDDGEFASPACLMYEADPEYMGLQRRGDPVTPPDVTGWRKAERARLIAARLALSAKARREHETRIAKSLANAVGNVDGRVVAAYWPFRGEPNLLPFLEEVESRGGRCALPVVLTRGRPLVFRRWSPGDPLVPGAWNIPVPLDVAETVVPEVVIAPVVGFDSGCHRLGYGGGFNDRTLSAWPDDLRTFGVGFALAALPSIFPQWHDVPMGAIITEESVVWRNSPAKKKAP